MSCTEIPPTPGLLTFSEMPTSFPPRHTGGYAETVLGKFKTDLKGSVTVVIRPENVQVSLGEAPNAVVASSEFFGHDQLVTLALADGNRIRSRIGPKPKYEIGQKCRVRATDARVYARIS